MDEYEKLTQQITERLRSITYTPPQPEASNKTAGIPMPVFSGCEMLNVLDNMSERMKAITDKLTRLYRTIDL